MAYSIASYISYLSTSVQQQRDCPKKNLAELGKIKRRLVISIIAMIRRSAPSAAAPVFTDQKDQDDNGKRKSARTQCDASIKLIFRQFKHIISLTFVFLLGARRVLMIVYWESDAFLGT